MVRADTLEYKDMFPFFRSYRVLLPPHSTFSCFFSPILHARKYTYRYYNAHCVGFSCSSTVQPGCQFMARSVPYVTCARKKLPIYFSLLHCVGTYSDIRFTYTITIRRRKREKKNFLSPVLIIEPTEGKIRFR